MFELRLPVQMAMPVLPGFWQQHVNARLTVTTLVHYRNLTQ